ncbi:MAG: hypothetical protein JRH08_16335 [Deltaproteobacteria bacterium]|nr:hypothetical protein [Deltaproteobacteria bacterium]MBW2127193.1 hypothetical protein [Deltaproteobacteria bacterium]
MAKKEDRDDELLDELIEGRKPEEILGESGLLKELTKRLVERALEGELTAHLGYAKRTLLREGTVAIPGTARQRRQWLDRAGDRVLSTILCKISLGQFLERR